uniref:Fucolectin tachylectin-4 pentraxin-1 domain-containing protein n=1 Tax=Neogobius melanostomus TaxID=47308 RepID=A0A8C6TL17_9GOBI
MKCIPVLFLLFLKTISALSENKTNLALGGEATQIDTYDGPGVASNAIDGNTDSNYHHGSCTHTLENTNAWWRVDLRDSYFITSVTVTNRGDCCARRLNGAQIRVGNSLLNNGNDNPVVATISRILTDRPETYTLAKPTEGRYVNVFLPGRGFLTLCEVEVYGYQDEKKNMARAGVATQIDTYDELGAASNAIDGNRDSIYSHKSCTHTLTTSDPWWRVDLRYEHAITSIVVKNRGDCCAQRLDGAEIRVGNSLANNGNDNPVAITISHIPLGLSKTFKFTKPVEGRYVNVFLPGTDKYLTLCEVEVYGDDVDKGESPESPM